MRRRDTRCLPLALLTLGLAPWPAVAQATLSRYNEAGLYYQVIVASEDLSQALGRRQRMP